MSSHIRGRPFDPEWGGASNFKPPTPQNQIVVLLPLISTTVTMGFDKIIKSHNLMHEIFFMSVW